MAFEGLTSRLQKAFRDLSGKGHVSKSDLRKTMRQIRLALLDADVNFDVVRKFVRQVQDKAVGANVLEGLNPSQQIVKIVDEELTKTMGTKAVPLNKAKTIPTVIMMVGLQGAGKTTTAGKLALRLKTAHKAHPLMIAADVYRPAAVDQLVQVGQQIKVPVFQMGTHHDPVDIVKAGLAQAHRDHNNYVIIDTAGRLQIDTKLMNELKRIKALAKPNEILLTVDAMTGQNAVKTAKGFNDALDITGVALTKLDGDTRGGAALSIRAVTHKPIKFVGEGEKLQDLDIFHPDRMASRILGMGDILTLIDKAKKGYDKKKAEKLTKKIQENTFDFNDFLAQLNKIQHMGPLKNIMKLIPGMANNPIMKKANMNPKQMDHIKAIVYSMTKQERAHPEILTPSRKRRIARGSGRPIQIVNRVIKQFNSMKKLMNQMSNGNFGGLGKMNKMMKRMGGKNPMGGMMGNNPMSQMSKFGMRGMAKKAKQAKKKRRRLQKMLRRR
ncbi:signal recognition particle protein [Acetilactobacillus jinshanensis]|uniref:Signal recognition particle protein n=1 Tax=Acetilactobacillus jinshanensis TaxID=1720083 RepID=A0A4P6ZL87_9LACO|nr:signal recognition particle protein [Acetilactobacillus jinshanensis]QBP18611.1 signal recognition particle protein [Acetilactobacillus jinshanensis]URL61487.1 signal recognition particle protein [uncultured bacterium]